MRRAAIEQVEQCIRGADQLTREATDAVGDPGRQARKLQAAGGARAYAEDLRAAAEGGALSRTGIDAGRLVAHAAHMGGWLTPAAVSQDDRRAVRALLRAGVFRQAEGQPGVNVARYELITPGTGAPNSSETASAPEVAATAESRNG